MKTLMLLFALFVATPAHAECTATQDVYLLFGDSRCLTGWPSDYVGIYLQAECPQAAIESSCRNGRGVFMPGSGTTDSPLMQLQGRMAVYSPDVVLLMLGLNDWNTLGATPESVADGLKELGDYAISQGAQPVIISGFPGADNGDHGRSDWSAEVRLRQVALAQAMDWPLIDTWEAYDQRTWVGCTVDPYGGGADFVHPRAPRCRADWANYVARRLP